MLWQVFDVLMLLHWQHPATYPENDGNGKKTNRLLQQNCYCIENEITELTIVLKQKQLLQKGQQRVVNYGCITFLLSDSFFKTEPKE